MQSMYKKPEFDLRLSYRALLEKSVIFSLLLLISVFYLLGKSHFHGISQVKIPGTVINIVNIPPTIQHKAPPRPTLPTIPVPVDDLEMTDAVSIDFGKVDISALAANNPPPAEKVEEFPFYAVEHPPVLIRKVKPVYPEIAQKAGIEGRVVVKVLVGKTGLVEKVELLKSIPMLDQAAINAAWQCKFRPGKQRDKFVKVWLSIPFKFYLK